MRSDIGAAIGNSCPDGDKFRRIIDKDKKLGEEAIDSVALPSFHRHGRESQDGTREGAPRNCWCQSFKNNENSLWHTITIPVTAQSRLDHCAIRTPERPNFPRRTFAWSGDQFPIEVGLMEAPGYW